MMDTISNNPFRAAANALLPLAFQPLPLGSIRPTGWLLRQLRLQADGLTGHLDEFWPDVGLNSAWLGGSGEAWERGPYYLDGLLPLAYLLDDEVLKAKARKWVDAFLSSQKEDGWFGPGRNKDDIWARMVVLKVLTQYADATGDPRVVPFMSRYFQGQQAALLDLPGDSWRGVRYADNVLSIYWLYERTGEDSLLGLARAQFKAGFDWAGWIKRFPDKVKILKAAMSHQTHGVNLAMAIKNPGMRYRLTHSKRDWEAVYAFLEQLDRYHGQVSGVFSADEHLAGRAPTQGTELCAVVEAMFSLEHLISILGDASLGDRLEQIAYNALPATLSADMWSHQYDQQANQVLCTIDERAWVDNGPDSNIFGLEPNFGCCTANLHQGWPKLTEHLWMSTPDGGLAAIAYGPNTVKAPVGKGTMVSISEETDYPFEGTIRMRLAMDAAAEFPIWLRLPAWAEKVTLRVNAQPVETTTRKMGYAILQRSWTAGDEIEIELPMELKTKRRSSGSVSLRRGPLVMALKVEEAWTQIGGTAPHADWQVKPLSAWNYGLSLSSTGAAQEEETQLRTPGALPWAHDAPGVEIKVHGKQIPEWGMVQNSAGPLPEEPVKSAGPDELLTLIPYGCARLRIAEFPIIDEDTP